MKNRKTTLNIIIYVLIFSVGFFGGFSCLEKMLNSYLNLFRISEWINGKQVLYIIVFVYAVLVFYPFWSDGLKKLNKDDLNEITSVLLLVALLGVVVKASFGGTAINSNLGITDNDIGFSQVIKLVIFSPVIEELYCRCAIMFLLKKYLFFDNVKCIVISALIFSAFHYKGLIGSNLNFIGCYLLIYFILGIGCSYLYLKTDNIVSSIILHMIWNGCMVGGYYIY